MEKQLLFTALFLISGTAFGHELTITSTTSETIFANTITSSAPSDDTYSWTIPSSLPESYQIIMNSISSSSTKLFSRKLNFTKQISSCEDQWEPNNSIGSASKYAIDSDFGRFFDYYASLRGTIHESGDWDYYRLSIENPGKLRLYLWNVPDEFDLQLYDSSGDYVAGSFTTGTEEIRVHVTPGYYYIVIGSVEGAYACTTTNLGLSWVVDLLLEVSPGSRSVGPPAGTITFDVSSNADWSASDTASWLSVTKTSPELLTVNFEENFDVQSRSANIVVSAEGATSDTVTITQDGAVCSLSVMPSSQTVMYHADTSVFSVNANLSWSVSENADWLSTSVNGSNIIASYNTNDSVTPRSALLFINGGACSDTATLLQEGAACILSVSPVSQEIGPEGGSASFTVSANSSWSVNENADWLTTSVEDDTITVAADLNESTKYRSAYIMVEGSVCLDTITLAQSGALLIFEISNGSVQLGAEMGASVTFQIDANVEWSITKHKPWLEVYPLSGTGSAEVRVDAVQSNTTGITRSDTIGVTWDGATNLVVVTQDFITAIQEKPGAGFQLYPNPILSQFTIESGIFHQYYVEITSLNGQQIYSKKMEGTSHEIDLSSFPNGVYFIIVRSKDLVTTRKIIKL